MSHDVELRGALALVRRRWLALVALRASARAALGVGLVLMAGVAVERLVAPAGAGLVLLAAAAGLGGAGLAVRLLWPLRYMPTDRQVARFIEERCPELEDRLATAVEAADRSSDRPAFSAAILSDAAARLRSIDRDRFVSRPARRRSAWQAAGGLAVLAAGLAMALGPAGRAWETLAFHLFPVTLTVEVVPGDARIVAGRPLDVRARVGGVERLPDGVVPRIEYRVGDERVAVLMAPEGGEWRFDFPAVLEDFRYRVTAAGVASPEFLVTAMTPPRVDRIDVRYEYPAFTGLPPRLDEDGGDIYGPAGTDVSLRVRADRPIDAGEMVFADGRRLTLERDGDDALVGTLRIEEDASYRIALRDIDGQPGGEDLEYFIRTMDDRPPEVRIIRPASDRQVTPIEEVRIEARAEDDYGIAGFELVYAVRGGDEIVKPLEVEGSATRQTGGYTLLLEDLNVEPGDFVTYYARVRDVSGGRPSTESRSDIFFIEVRPFHEEFFAAQTQAMSGAGSGDATLDQIAAAQKEIIVATWQLDRRASAGRSEQDIRAVEAAQGELKARTEQLVRGQGRAQRGLRPGRAGQVRESPDEDPLFGAIDAMARAQGALEAIRTSEALPHEMEALNQLLRVQAEIRRRQVAQEGAGGGGSRQQGHQDLSTLFDRELQRQQQTNYETRTAPDRTQPSDSSDSDALDRVRDLARRQDELSRQQQDLAARRAEMTSEEIKRQLERLTREQSDLRKQAEELTRELASRDRARGEQQGTDGSSGVGSGEQMRQALEDMQSAASDLRRQDAQGAAESGAQARDRLRALERQLRGAEPDERRRRLGEVRLEARQVAEAQRRIADEAKRLQDGEAGTDARRRLVGDKERLADRVERLERSTQELASGSDGPERTALDEAARTLQREQVSRRMRETAGVLRGGHDGTDVAQPAAGVESAAKAEGTVSREQQLSSVLDRVAEELSGVGAPRDHESQRLSDQLAEARGLRDRLEEIERRIEDLVRGTEAQAQGEAGARQESVNAPADAGASPAVSAEGSQGTGGSEGADADLAKLQAAYGDELRRVRELLDELRRDNPGTGPGLSTPEQHEHVLSAPGTEAFKQDFARWDVLRRDVHSALEAIEIELSGMFADREIRDRLNAGADERTPEEYRRLVEKYYQALARKQP